MGLGSLIAGLAASAVSAASSAAKNSSKSSSSKSSSSKSSGSSSGSSGRTGSTSVSFDSGTDYQAKINDAVSRGDYASAARYEQQRNAKIDAGQGGSYQKTNNYSKYLSSTSNPNGGKTVNGTYVPAGTYNDAGLSAGEKAKIAQYKQQYEDAQARGDTAAMQAAHQAAENIRIRNGYYGGYDGSDYISTGYGNGPESVGSIVGGGLGAGSGLTGGYGSLGGQMVDYTGMLQSGFEQYRDYMEQAAAQQRAELQAKVDAAVAQLNANRADVSRLTADNNAAAERAYMQTIRPNGSLAENLAANGLLTSGATESSQIAAGNTYQTALNENARTEAEAISQLEQAIVQAQLTGDIEAANAYANVLQQIAEKGYQNVQDIVSAGQWQQNFALNEAGVTGTYNGAPTLEAQRLQMEKDQYEQQKLQIQQQLQLGQIDIQTAQKELAMYDQQIAMLEEQIRGQQLSNTAQELQNKYYQTQF